MSVTPLARYGFKRVNGILMKVIISVGEIIAKSPYESWNCAQDLICKQLHEDALAPPLPFGSFSRAHVGHPWTQAGATWGVDASFTNYMFRITKTTTVYFRNVKHIKVWFVCNYSW